MGKVNEPNYDPGTGSNFSHETKRIINKDGSFNVQRIGTSFNLNDAYLHFIQMDWPPFLLILFTGFVLLNVLFALLYFILGNGHLGMVDHTSSLDFFLHCFYFSTQTFTTVGYGAISPSSNTASLIAAFEAFFGFLSFSLATGLLFGRFSRPNAKIRYSKNALVSKVNGERALIFRLANARSTPLLDLRATVIFSMSKNDEYKGIHRTYSRLNLQVSNIDFMPLNWTIVHFINDDSPFFQMTDDDILNSGGELLVHIRGFDEAFSQEVHSRFSYKSNEMMKNAVFKRAFSTDDSGEVTLDLSRLDDLEILN
jgi:inward rectifier potassium channel